MRGIQFFGVVFIVVLMSIAGCSKKATTDPVVTPPVATTPGKSYYVSDGLGNDANTGLTASSPMKKISTAANLAEAGDTVFIMNGTYATSSTILNITKSGAPDRYITFKALAGHTPKITVSGNVWNTISINGSYIVIDGLELQGNNAGITYTEAYAAYSSALGGAAVDNSFAKFNTNGISIGGPRAESKFPHHIAIRNCKVHDFPGGGVGAIQADYITFEGNTIYNNAWYMMYAGSGISILTPFNSDAGSITKYKNIVRNNICYGNKTTIPWIGITPSRLSDGNGIIIDVNQTGYSGVGPAFNGRTLVENNVSFNNGGSGIHAYKADHVDIVNNTAYFNGTVVGYPDIYAGSATDVKIANNIMYSRPAASGGKCNATPSGGTFVTYDFNIYFNGTVAVQGVNDKIMNPQFVNASTDGSVANFSLLTGSPAIDAGTKIIYSAKDINGIARPLGATVDCGAYEIR